MNQPHEKVSSTSSATLDREDQTAMDRANGTPLGDSAIQGAASPSPGVGDPKGSPAPTPGAQLVAGLLATLCNEFFVRRFGQDKGLSPGFMELFKADVGAALDTYFPDIQAKPGISALLILGSHYVLCAREAANARQSASLDKAAPEKPPSSNGSSPESSG